MSLAPKRMGTSNPIVREKNGRMEAVPNWNKSLFSIKNCRLSGKNRLNRSRLVTCLSTSTCEKSGLMVRSKLSELDNAILASNPPCGLSISGFS